jgi:PAS domain S-box-containing protein
VSSPEIVSSTSEPAFAVDLEGRIQAWNAAAEQLFGYPASEVLESCCWEVLAGRDLYGNDYCMKHCQLRQMAQQGRPVHPCVLVFRDAAGDPIEARVSLLVAPGGRTSAPVFVHLLSPVDSEGQEAGFRRVCADNRNARLSERELEVLGRLAEGMGTQEIAKALGLSPYTSRNHIQHILDKLQVHSRLAAVALARRLGLIE